MGGVRSNDNLIKDFEIAKMSGLMFMFTRILDLIEIIQLWTFFDILLPLDEAMFKYREAR